MDFALWKEILKFYWSLREKSVREDFTIVGSEGFYEMHKHIYGSIVDHVPQMHPSAFCNRKLLLLWNVLLAAAEELLHAALRILLWKNFRTPQKISKYLEIHPIHPPDFPWYFPRTFLSGNLSEFGKFFRGPGWVSQYLPCYVGAWVH